MTRDDSAVVDWLTAPERVPEAIATALRAVRSASSTRRTDRPAAPQVGSPSAIGA